MITEKDVREAIAYCQGKLDPKRDDAVLLAACIIIQREMFGSDEPVSDSYKLPAYSYAAPPDTPETNLIQSGESPAVGDYGDSDFLRSVAGKNPATMWAVMDELMDTLKMVNERVYNSVMRKIR